MKHPPELTTGAALADIPTSAEIGTAPVPTLASVQTVLNAMATVMASEPVARWMAAQGCSPRDGWLLVLPAAQAGKTGRLVPSYVRFSNFVAAPTLFCDTVGISA